MEKRGDFRDLSKCLVSGVKFRRDAMDRGIAGIHHRVNYAIDRGADRLAGLWRSFAPYGDCGFGGRHNWRCVDHGVAVSGQC